MIEIIFPDEILIIIMKFATFKSFKTIQCLFKINKQFYHIMLELIQDKKIFDGMILTIPKYYINYGKFPQPTLISCLKLRGFTMFHSLENFYLHGLCKKWNINNFEIEFMNFNLGKLISHTIKKEKTYNQKLYVFKNITFYPTLKFEKFNEHGITIKIVTCNYIKTFDIDGLKIYINKKNNYKLYNQAFQKEISAYKDIEKWIATYIPKIKK